MSKIHKVTVIVHRNDGRRHLAYFFFNMEGDRSPWFCAFGSDITNSVWGWEYV